MLWAYIVLITVFFIALLILFTCIFFKCLYKPRFSVLFMGETKETERKIIEDSPINLIELNQLIVKQTVYTMVNLKFKTKLNSHIGSKKLIRDHPHHFLGYALDAYTYRIEKKLKRSKKKYDTARGVRQQHKDLNQSFSNLFPSEAALHGLPWNITLVEEVENTIWRVDGPFKGSPDNDFTELQASIVRLQNGKLIMINPIAFTHVEEGEKVVEQIKALGEMYALITPCAAHSIAIEICANIWPNAKLYGTDAKNKHGKKNLPWAGFLSNDEQLFEPDLTHILIEGQVFCETVFYHKQSKTLLGLTDLGVKTSDYQSWAMVIYCLSFGMWRGSYTTEIASQSYQNFLMPNRKKFRESLHKILDLDLNLAILGHSGVLENPKLALESCYHWVLDEKNDLSAFEKIYYPVAYLLKLNVPSIMCKVCFTLLINKLKCCK